MKQSVQVRVEIYEGQHDALLDFLTRYNKLFANKLLLRLCEEMIDTYKPKLTLFIPFPEETRAGKTCRYLVFQLKSIEYPKLWKFYKELPHGSRLMVLTNLINHYLQMIENDHEILERIYWGEAGVIKAEEQRSVVNQPVAGGPLPLPIVEYETDKENLTPSMRVVEGRETTYQAEGADYPDSQPEPDPLVSMSFNL